MNILCLLTRPDRGVPAIPRLSVALHLYLILHFSNNSGNDEKFFIFLHSRRCRTLERHRRLHSCLHLYLILLFPIFEVSHELFLLFSFMFCCAGTKFPVHLNLILLLSNSTAKLQKILQTGKKINHFYQVIFKNRQIFAILHNKITFFCDFILPYQIKVVSLRPETMELL